MVTDNSSKDERTGARTGKDDKMLSAKEVEKLLREDAQAYMKQFKKTPQELRQWFDQMMEQLEREGIDDDMEEYLDDEDESA